MNGSAPPSPDRDASREWEILQRVQAGMIGRRQATRIGFSSKQLEYRLNAGVWQRAYPGVYATFNGSLSREARLWAVVLWAGPGALLSHETAAELHGLIEKGKGAGAVHVTVPVRRRPAQRRSVPGIDLHRSDLSRADFVGPFKLPRTRIEDTVLDLVAGAGTFEHGYTWIARAVSRQLVTVGELRAALARRSRIRWRAWLADALDDARAGVHSPLELRYVRDVERAHRLPRSLHQERREFGGKVHYRDIWYPEYRLIVEIDGPGYHQNEQVQLDNARDNLNLAVEDVRTYRFGPADLTEHACRTAVMVATTLKRNGWQEIPRSCRRPGCAIGPGAQAKPFAVPAQSVLGRVV
jgi:hypothetical protein